ncbi:MAG: hypothetical protein EXX96DRAFT_494975 [Benjaminiella poitrasii]|nr:MAG: hypothetical protein EXX96DRAFT_494975 [Benjaminiella poitrasii]
MSNPIADTAVYFAEREERFKQLHISPNSQRNYNNDDNDYLASPESPENRRPQPQTIHHTLSDFDPKLQWQKVMKRLPNLARENSRHSHRTIHTTNTTDSSSSSSSDSRSSDNGGSEGDSDERENNTNGNHHETRRFGHLSHRIEQRRRKQQEEEARRHNRYDEQDDVLPEAEELPDNISVERLQLQQEQRQQLEEEQEHHQNYFENPFKTSIEDDDKDIQNTTTAESPTKPTVEVDTEEKDNTKRTESGGGSGSGGETEVTGKAKKHWGKTLDKVRLIANLHTLPHQHKVDNVISTSSLAPYYPPLFDPVFIALSKDQHGRPWVAVTDSGIQTQGINQWVFRIELQYGDIKWVIKRTIADFVSLHYTLKFKSSIKDAVPSPPSFPNQLESWFNSAKESIRLDEQHHTEIEGEKYKIALKRRKALTKYLRQLLIRAHMMANYDICEFFEISAVSIVEDMGWKGKEGFLENKVNFVIPRLCHVLKPHFWNTQWVMLRDSYVAFIEDVSSTRIDDVLLFDKSLVVQNKKPGLLGRYHNHITIENRFRRIEIKGSRREIDDWMESIQRVLSESPWVKNHRFGSFAPIRHNAKVRWFVDGEDHFNAVGEAILSAKSEIYIADWWLSPELYLRRPPEKNKEFRLDRLLKRKAEEGVKIYVIVYKEMAVALTINSAHTKLWLQGLHKNIIVVRHPDHRSIDNNVLFWSHHEKMVVVDNRLAFIGGLDLCWGRYDSQKHRLTDYPSEGHSDEVFPGQDYSNPRVKDFLNVAQFDLTLVDRKITPRMPWHDMTVGMVGPIARDVARHFIKRWNFLKASKGMHRPTVPFLMPKGEYVAVRDESSFKGTCRVQLLRSSAQWSSGIEREHSIYNAYMECITKSKHFIYIENQFFISATTQDKLLRNKIAQALVERIKRAHAKGEKFKVFIIMPLIPAFEGDLATKDAAAARNVMHFQYITISRGGNSIIEKLREAGIDPSEYIGWYSLRNWDKLVPPSSSSSHHTTTPPTSPKQTSVPPVNVNPDTSSLEPDNKSKSPNLSERSSSSEKSIWDDDDRQYYVSELVYIHDKIMIVDDRLVLIGSANINDRSQLGNRDSEVAMLIEDTQTIPSFMNGKEYKAAKFAHTLRMQLFKEHLGLLDFTRWEQLMKGMAEREPNVDVDDPIETHHTNERATEEEIRYFETAKPDKVLEHEKRSGPQIVDSSEFGTMAVRLDAKALDPLAEHCYRDIWEATAENNTMIYRKLFRCVPDDTVHTFEQHRKFLPDPTKIPHGHIADPDLHGRDIRQQLAKVRGHLVQFPTNYLKDENMLGSLIRETVTPMIIFT